MLFLPSPSSRLRMSPVFFTRLFFLQASIFLTIFSYQLLTFFCPHSSALILLPFVFRSGIRPRLCNSEFSSTLIWIAAVLLSILPKTIFSFTKLALLPRSYSCC